MKVRLLAVLLVVPFVVWGCGSSGGSGASNPTPTPTSATCTAAAPAGFHVVGYMPSWTGNVADIDFAKLTHINYAFAIPNADGSLQDPDPAAVTKLQDLVAQAHSHGVRVLLSIGGWMNCCSPANTPFATFAATANGRQKFVQAVTDIINNYSLDGADIDWEYPQAADQANYTALIHALATSLHPGKLLTAAVGVSSYGASGVGADSLADFDWVNMLAYDGDTGAGHSPYSLAVAAFDFWSGRGLPAAKAVLGLPFYSQPGLYPYSWLVTNYPDAPNHDSIAGQYYNGIGTIKQKTCLAMQRGGGVMIWDLSDDTHDATSLLTALYSVIHP